MKSLLIASTFAFISMLSMAQMDEIHKNSQLLEIYKGEDTLQFIMSYKTNKNEILDGRFDALKNGNTIL